MVLLIQQAELEHKKDSKTKLSSAGSIPQYSIAETRPGQSQEPGTQSRSTMWVGPNHVSHHLLLLSVGVSRMPETEVKFRLFDRR